MRSLHWFRTDLRIQDNTALINAMKDSSELLTVFIIPLKSWEEHKMASAKIQFILDNLKILSKMLENNGVTLLIKTTNHFSDIPNIIKSICEEYAVKALYFNKEYEVNELRRDKSVENCLSVIGVSTYSFDDQMFLEPNKIFNKKGEPFKVFTPFKKSYIEKLAITKPWKIKRPPEKTFKLLKKPDKIPNNLTDNLTLDLKTLSWHPGENYAKELLVKFCHNNLLDYHDKRDFPGLFSTSHLSPYLAQGIISPRQCLNEVMSYLEIDELEEIFHYKGASTWFSELIWRDFFKQVIIHFPRVCCHKPFRLMTDHIPWRHDKELFQAWCDGMTGFPIIDAAMRQLKHSAWMHNRLRMLVANFLTKLLLIDWRWGEEYFIHTLIDGDLSANNGNWQWSASTGTDAAPYFRIFNPTTQSEKYDPNGEFIKLYCPELSHLDNNSVHEPYQRAPLLMMSNAYPKPIIDLKKNRQITLSAFRQINENFEKKKEKHKNDKG